MTRLLALVFAVVLLPACATLPAPGGVVTVASPYSVEQTAERVESLAAARGLRVFLSVDHAAGAASIGESLAPTRLVVFGNPKGGTPLMQCSQVVGIDLPLKALVWEDAAGDVWVGYNDLAAVAARHGISDCPAVGRVATALDTLIGAVVAAE